MSYWGVGLGIGLLYGFIVGIFVVSAGLNDDVIWGFIIPFQIYTIVGIWSLLITIKVQNFVCISENSCNIWNYIKLSIDVTWYLINIKINFYNK